MMGKEDRALNFTLHKRPDKRELVKKKENVKIRIKKTLRGY